jgi:hypothetical protein
MDGVAAVLWHPRSKMTEVARRPVFISTWIGVLVVVSMLGAGFLSTSIGHQALVDERVRVVEALGGRVDDATYAALESNPPFVMYLTSGGRLLLAPPVTLAVALGILALARIEGTVVRLASALAIAVHASVVLAVQQVVAVPLHYVRESLTNPTNLAGLVGVFDESSWVARLLGSVDIFAVWWLWLLALGLGAATSRPSSRYLWRLALVYVGIAASVATVFALLDSN